MKYQNIYCTSYLSVLVFMNSVEKYQHTLSLSAFTSTPTSLVANTTSVLYLQYLHVHPVH